jgi:hypothetical protein
MESTKAGTTPGSEGMLANFFNSLLNKNPKGGTPVPGTKAGQSSCLVDDKFYYFMTIVFIYDGQ